MAKVEIKSDGIETKLVIDGIDISNITSAFSLSQEGGNVPILTVKIIGTEISVDSNAYPQFPDHIAEFIKEWSENSSAASAGTETAE